MLLVVDIGNTNITLGLYDNDELKGTFRFTTKTKRTSDEYGIVLTNLLFTSSCKIEDIEGIIISSVVPKLMHSFINAVKKYLKQEPLIVGPGIKTGITINIEDPRSVGADRIVDLAGALAHYPTPCLVLDFGTANTYDYLDANATFTYGVTSPGIEISANALWNNAAKLPEIEIVKPDSILVKNTVTSMQAGLVYGAIGECEYIISQYKKALNLPELFVVATGGLGRLVSSHTKMIDVYDAELTFKGLKAIYYRNKA